MSLSSVDDELELIDLLKTFCTVNHRQVEVFFDGAPPGYSGLRRYGLVSAYFVQKGRTADEAIRLRLRQLGKAARNWTVVSSDHQVLAEARAAGAETLTSDAFASQLGKPGPPSNKFQGKTESPGLDPDDLDEWLRLFGDDTK
jgi:predicted RNA-binding protein with PIN domain